jgi:hypothetical protein
VANISNTVISGKTKGGYRSALYRDASGHTFKCEVRSGPVGGPFTIYIPSLKPAGAAAANKTGIVLGTSRGQTNCVFASYMQP